MFQKWFARRKPAEVEQRSERAWSPGEGWRMYYSPLGGFDPELANCPDAEVIREGWDCPIPAKSLSPLANAIGLYWRPRGPMIDVTPSVRQIR